MVVVEEEEGAVGRVSSSPVGDEQGWRASRVLDGGREAVVPTPTMAAAVCRRGRSEAERDVVVVREEGRGVTRVTNTGRGS